MTAREAPGARTRLGTMPMQSCLAWRADASAADTVPDLHKRESWVPIVLFAACVCLFSRPSGMMLCYICKTNELREGLQSVAD